MPRRFANPVNRASRKRLKKQEAFRGWTLLRPAIVLLVAGSLSAQSTTASAPLTLQQAVTIALEKNPLRKAAVADTHAASAGVQEARSFLLPHLNFTETATRGNDPVYIFGSKLRQQRFTANDFTLNRLNTPLPYGNFASRFGGTWNLFDSFATLRRITRARNINEAAVHQLDRTDQEILFRVVQAYYGAEATRSCRSRRANRQIHHGPEPVAL
jgi:outer membrane protein